jgi:hypothetical protein
MIALYLHPTADREPDFTLDSPALIEWWKGENIVGGSVLVPVEDLRPVIEAMDGAEDLKAAFRRLEDAHVVMVKRSG